jgi:hypothetical protein
MGRNRDITVGALILIGALFSLLPCTATAAPPITPRGVGSLRIGTTVENLHRKSLIGGLRKGCELDRGQMAAPLRAPLRGWAIFSNGRRLSSISIEGGAETRRHIGVGATAAEARSAYPQGEWSSPSEMYPIPIGVLWLNSARHARMSLVVDPTTYRVESIAVPAPNICE